MMTTSYQTFIFTNGTGQRVNGLHLYFAGPTEIVSVDGKPPEGLGHGDYSIFNAGSPTPDIADLETAPRGKRTVRVKGINSNVRINTRESYWTKDFKPMKSSAQLIPTKPTSRKKVAPFVVS